jgi:elongation factor Ts
MADITAADVKRLRDATGAGMMDCKKALVEADGDFDKAVELSAIKGMAKAQSRGAERTASNGLVAAAENALIELACETDFVAKNEQFQQLAPTSRRTPRRARRRRRRRCTRETLADGKTVAENITSLSR